MIKSHNSLFGFYFNICFKIDKKKQTKQISKNKMKILNFLHNVYYFFLPSQNLPSPLLDLYHQNAL